MASLSYDPACVRHEVAIKAIWLLYRRGRWGLIRRLFPTLQRDDLEMRFESFDDKFIPGPKGKINNRRQLFALLMYFPDGELIEAAVKMVARYQAIMKGLIEA